MFTAYLKYLFTLLVGLFVSFQFNAQLQINFSDLHEEQIVETKIHPSQEFIITRDRVGKIILWNTHDYSYVKTLFTPAFNNVTSMHWLRKGNAIGITQNSNASFSSFRSDRDRLKNGRYDTLAYYTDTLIVLPVFDSIKTSKFKASLDFIGPNSRDFKIVAQYMNNRTTIHALDVDSTFNNFFISSPYPHQYAADINESNNQILIGTSNHFVTGNPILTLMKTDDYSLIDTTEIPFKPQYILFDENINKYLIIGLNLKTHQLNSAFYNPEDQILENTQAYSKNLYARNDIIHNTYDLGKGKYRIVINVNNIEPHIFEYSQGRIEPYNSVDSGIMNNSSPFFLLDKGLMGLFNHNSLNNQFTKIELEIWDYRRKQKIDRFDIKGRSVTKSSFLRDGSWITTGFKSINQSFIKYFPSDKPLNNRFSSVYFLDYIEEANGIDNISYYHIDQQSGEIVFAGWRNDQKRYFVYDLINDSISQTIKDPKEEYNNPLDFSGDHDRILVRDGHSPNLPADGYYYLRIIDSVQNIKLKKPIVRSIISDDGEYLLTEDDSNVIKIYAIKSKLKKIYEQNFGDSVIVNIKKLAGIGFSYSASKIGSDFGIKSYVLETTDELVKVQQFDNLKVFDFQKIKNFTIAIFGLGDIRHVMAYKDDKLKYKKTYGSSDLTPNNLSINIGESRLMLNCSQGVTEIVNLDTFKSIGEMTHFNENEQVIVSSPYFSANCDVSRVLVASENGKQVKNKEWIDQNNKPAEVAHLFGIIDDNYKDFLSTVENVKEKQDRTTENKQRRSEHLAITSIEFPSLSGDMVSHESNLSVHLTFDGTRDEINGIEIKINDGFQKYINASESTVQINDNTLSFPIDLLNGENDIKIRLADKDSLFSNYSETFIINTRDKKGDLYLLSVGISEYQDARYNLTYADKDAMDISLIYGDTNDIDLTKYRMKFYSNNYQLIGSGTNFSNKHINHLNSRDSWFSDFDLHAVDSTGRFWVETKDHALILWDFKKGDRQTIFRDTIINSAFNEFYPTDDNKGFYFYTSISSLVSRNAYYYDFLGQNIVTNKVPPNILRYKDQDHFWTYELQFMETNTPIYIKEVGLFLDSLVVLDTLQLVVSKKNEKGELDIITVNSKGTALLMNNEENELFLASIVNNKVNYKELPEAVYDPTKEYMLLKNNLLTLDRFESKYWSQSILSNDIIETDIASNIAGINLYGQHPKKILRNKPLEEKNISPISDKSIFDIYSNHKPTSFNKTHITCLVDKNATKENILDKLNLFAQDIQPNDQVILFMAGHGVLNNKNQFLFAPHDMNFENVEEHGLSYRTIMKKIKSLNNANKLILLDACHSGNLYSEDNLSEVPDSAQNDSGNTERGAIRLGQSTYNSNEIQKAADFLFKNVISESGITVLSASSGDNVAYEGLKNLSNGNFTASFISILINNLSNSEVSFVPKDRVNGLQLTDELLYEINQKIITTSKNKQIPNIREINRYARIYIW